jgi:hypothetical protein
LIAAGYDTIDAGSVNMMMEYVNFIIAALTNIGCVYIVVSLSYWLWKLRCSDTNMRPLLLGIIFAKVALWLWSATAMLQIVALGGSLPAITLPSRVLILAAVITHVHVTTRIRPGFPGLYKLTRRQ